MKTILLLLFCLAIFVNSFNGCSATKEFTDKSIKFVEISKGPASGIDDNKQVVIRSETEFNAKFKEVNSIFFPEPEAPAIDFSKYIVIAVFQGTKNNGGYSIKIEKIRYEEDGNVKVTVIETSPGRNCVTTDAITHPYYIVKIPKTDEKIVFIVKQEVFDCK
ncbi:hypothetical protein BH10BAC5_BH10BAC5_10110 [soil metagenome]